MISLQYVYPETPLQLHLQIFEMGLGNSLCSNYKMEML